MKQQGKSKLRVHKRAWRDRNTGERRQASRWSVKWYDEMNSQWATWRGYEREDASVAMGEALVAISAARAEGRTLDPALERWIDKQSQKTMVKLAELRLVDASRVAGAQLLADHVKAYERWRMNNGFHRRDTGQVINRINRVCAVAGFKVWSDIQLQAFENALFTIRDESGDADGNGRITPRTVNRYAMAMKALLNWMADRGHAKNNPLKKWKPIKEADREHRRGFTREERDWLLAVTMDQPAIIGRTRKGRAHFEKEGVELPGGIRWNITGRERALLYRFAIEAAQRRGALQRLTVGDFHGLAGAEPYVHFAAAAGTKSRDENDIPVREDTAPLLAEHLAGREPSAPAFQIPDRTADMIQADMAAARQAWIADAATAEERTAREKSDFLAPIDSEGRALDFHSLRVTSATWMANMNVPIHIAKKVTGHRSTDVHRRHYQRTEAGQVREAISALPPATDPRALRAALRASGGSHDARMGSNGSEKWARCDSNAQPPVPKCGACVAPDPHETPENIVFPGKLTPEQTAALRAMQRAFQGSHDAVAALLARLVEQDDATP